MSRATARKLAASDLERRALQRATGLELLEGDPLQRTHLLTREAELETCTLILAEGSRVLTGDAAKDHQRIEIVAISAGVIVVVSPEVDHPRTDAEIGIGRGNALLNGAHPG